ncbi:MAG: transposase, partial [Gammaproteobacteria bacterium]
QQVFGIALGYEDINDHEELRHDPMMAVLAGKLQARREDCAPVAGKSTLNRLELSLDTSTRYHKIAHDPSAIEALFVTLFLEAHKTPPDEIILDLDAAGDLLHGHQEGEEAVRFEQNQRAAKRDQELVLRERGGRGRFFHGYYDCYCYLPLYIFCGRHLLAAKLRPANIDGAAGAVEETARIVAQIRERWPRVRIILRAGFRLCPRRADDLVRRKRRRLHLGLAKNLCLNRLIGAESIAAREESRVSGEPARRFKELSWPARKSWSRERRVIAKAEWTQGGANPRYIVTSLTAADGDGRWLYEDVYCAPGEMENRIKECQMDLFAGRTIRRRHDGQPTPAVVCLDGLRSGR